MLATAQAPRILLGMTAGIATPSIVLMKTLLLLMPGAWAKKVPLPPVKVTVASGLAACARLPMFSMP